MATFLQKATKFEIAPFTKKPKSLEEIKKTHVSFTGSPYKHADDSKKFILVADPFSSHTFFYEFKVKDISYIEELPSVSEEDGETVTMVRIWVKKKSIGLRCTPFIVEDTEII